MPVNKVLVEGKLETTILSAVLGGAPLVERGGSKNALKPQVEEQRRRTGQVICYLRDRDFDDDPPHDRTRPKAHSERDGFTLGWAWCRHEMENYLLEPEIVARATGADRGEYEAALLDAATRICAYQAARGAIGETRRSLLPPYELNTRPVDIPTDPPRIPDALDADTVSRWARDHAGAFRDRVCPQLAPVEIQRCFEERRRVLERARSSVAEVLIWFSGKDLFAALSPWSERRGFPNPGDLRALLRDWMKDHPEDVLAQLPEWRSWVEELRR